MIDTFTREQFEAALPVSKKASISLMIPAPIVTKLWQPLGLVDGEFAYLIKVKADLAIMIRSSIRPDGKSAPIGKDSIRSWIVRVRPNHDRPYAPWGSKVSKYVTRVPGWQRRLTDTLRTLYKMALSIERCPACKEWMKVFKVKKEGPRHGELFLKCQCGGRDSMKFLEVA